MKNAENTYKTPSFDFTQDCCLPLIFAHPMAKITYHLWIASNLLEFLSWILPQNQENFGREMVEEAYSKAWRNWWSWREKNQMQLQLHFLVKDMCTQVHSSALKCTQVKCWITLSHLPSTNTIMPSMSCVLIGLGFGLGFGLVLIQFKQPTCNWT